MEDKIIINYTEYRYKGKLSPNFKDLNNKDKIKFLEDSKLLHREDGPAVYGIADFYEYWLNGERHREEGPAYKGRVKLEDGDYYYNCEIWIKNGKYHREDGPAIKCPNGHKQWHINGELHRKDGPAVINPGRYEYWYLNGLRHRLDGPAEIDENGNKKWWLNGLLHRIGGPAEEYFDGSNWWYLDGKKHRLDGPAAINYNGYKAWYLNNKEVDEEIFKKIEESTKEELLMYMVLPKYKDYISLIEYKLNII